MIEKPIFVVEDDATVRRALVDTLADNVADANSIRAFADGVDLLAFWWKQPFTDALVISDIVMPRLGGFELYDRLGGRFPALKFLFVTGYPVNQEAEYFLKRERLEILRKPFRPAELMDAVHKVLK